jgi:hypothetical protein
MSHFPLSVAVPRSLACLDEGVDYWTVVDGESAQTGRIWGALGSRVMEGKVLHGGHATMQQLAFFNYTS